MKDIKITLSLILIVIFLFSIVGCGKKTIDKKIQSSVTSSVTTSKLASSVTSSSNMSSGQSSVLSGTSVSQSKSTSSSVINSGGIKSEANRPKVKLTFGILNDIGTIKNAETFMEQYKKDNPNVTIIEEKITGDYDAAILARASAHTLPDVFWVADVRVAQFSSKGALLQLDPYIKSLNFNMNDLYPSSINLGKFNGKQYMIPYEYSHVVVYYNKKMFTDSNVIFPKNNWTWDEFIATSRKLVQKNGTDIIKFGSIISLDWHATIIPIIEGLGGKIISDAGNTSLINTPETVNALTQIKGLVDEGVIENQWGGNPGFFSNKVGMYFGVRPNITEMTKFYGSDGFDVVTFPRMPAKALQGSGASGYAVSAWSKNKEEATRMLLSLVTQSGQKILESSGNVVPVRIDMINDSIWRKYPSTTINHDAFILYPERDLTPLDCRIKNTEKASSVYAIYKLAFEKLFTGKSTVQAALDECDQRLDIELA